MKIRIFILLLFVSYFIKGQSVIFEQITNESGRSLGFVSGMLQDSVGFFWLATRDGLYRYDGYSYKLFRHNRKDSLSIPYNDLTYLYRDNENVMWMRHYNSLFAFKDEKLYYPDKYFKDSKFDINTEILQDKNNDYWIGPVKRKIIHFSRYEKKVDTFTLSSPMVSPKLFDWLKANNPDFVIENYKTIDFNKSEDLLVLTPVESSGKDFYDYGKIKYGDNKILLTQKNLKTLVRENSLLKFSIEIIHVEKGTCEFKFIHDKLNSFARKDYSFSKYGMFVYKITGNSEIAKEALTSYYPKNTIPAGSVKNMVVNNQGNITLLTDRGIHIYKNNKWEFINVDFQKMCENNVSSDSYTMPFIQDTFDNYWVGYAHGLIKISDSKARTYKLFDKNKQLFHLYENHLHKIWILTADGFYVFNPKSLSLNHFVQTNTNRLYSNKIWNVLEDKSYNTWIATTGGLNQLRSSRFNVVKLPINKFAKYPIVSCSNEKILLPGNKNRLILLNVKKRSSKTLFLPSELFQVDSEINDTVYDINDLCLKNNRLWVAYSDRLAVLQYPQLSIVKTYKLPTVMVDNQQLDNSANLILSENNEIWLVAADGVYLFDESSLTNKRRVLFNNSYESIFDYDKRFVKNVVYNSGVYYIRTSKSLLKFNPDSNKMISLCDFDESLIGTSLANGNIAIDSSGKYLWLTSFPQVLKINTNTQGIDTFNIDLNKDLGDCYTYILDTSLWICSNNGLIKFCPDKNETEYFTSNDGLIDNNINGLIADKYNNLWLTSYKGLTKFNIVNHSTEKYFQKSGFNPINFLRQHYHHEYLGNNVLLPATSGIVSFNPDSINSIKPNIVLSNVYLFGKTMVLDSLAYKKKLIELNHKQNFLTFELSSLDFTEPAKNRYRYRLENFNEQWIYTDANNRKAPYTGLPPGDYVFIAQGTNNEGLWSDPLKIEIVIHPPWWRTTLAYILYVIVGTLSIVFFIRYRERQLIIEKRVLENKVAERTKEIMKKNEEITKQRDEIIAQKKDITDSIHYASRIQTALLPQPEFIETLLKNYFILWKPRDIVSGDYYWLHQMNRKTIIVAADCTGHGVPGAFMSMLGISFLNEIVAHENVLDSDQILNKLRQYVIKSLKQTGEDGGSKDGMDISLTIIDHDLLTAQFSGAYNPLYVLRDNDIQQIKADKMPIGYHIKADVPFTKNEVQLRKKDRIYMFSDGYADQFGGEKGRKFMSKRFKKLLIETSNVTMDTQRDILDKTIEDWKGEEYSQIDDILIIGVEI